MVKTSGKISVRVLQGALALFIVCLVSGVWLHDVLGMWMMEVC